jgi:hypothetical protein
MNDHRRQKTRAVRLIGVLSIGLILASLAPGVAGGKETEFITGSGTSYAQTIRIGPTAGQLSLAPVFGLSLADYVNTVGRGQATLADWAGIGVAERSLPDNTPFVKVASTEKDSEKGKTVIVGGQSDGTTGGGAAELFARATDAPFGESTFRGGSFEVPGLIEMRGGVSHSTAGVKGRVREATAETDIGLLSLAGGVVTLKGLHWTSVQRTGDEKKLIGAFTIDGVAIAGAALPMPQGSDFAAVIDPINAALAPTGLAISLPVIEKNGGESGVTPMSIDIKNSPAGRQFIAPILEALRPAREPVADAFIDLAKQLVEANPDIPDATVGLLLADLTLGILSGSSQLHIELGGVSAFTEGEAFESPFGKGINFNPPKVGAVETVFTPGKPGTPAVPGTAVGSEEGTLVASPASPIRTIPGDKGGAAVAVGLIGLSVAIALATRDYWKMRQIKREAASA